MGELLSADLRKQIVSDVEGGNSRCGAAVAPARLNRPKDSGKLGPHRAFIITHLEDKRIMCGFQRLIQKTEREA